MTGIFFLSHLINPPFRSMMWEYPFFFISLEAKISYNFVKLISMYFSLIYYLITILIN
jgi:hypothetical protein